MSIFSDALCRAQDRIIKVHGCPMIFKTSRGMANVDGIIVAPFGQLSTGEVFVNGNQSLIRIKQRDQDRILAQRGDEVLILETTYTVEELRPDNRGMVSIELRKMG